MNCPLCKTPDSSVINTRLRKAGSVVRRRECRCGYRWSTRETSIKQSGEMHVRDVVHRHTANEPSHVRQIVETRTTESTPANPPLLSDPIRSGSSPDSPDLSKPIRRDSNTMRPAKVLAPPKYSPEFERLWSAIANGSKSDANKAWHQVGAPDVNRLISSWAAWNRIAWVDGIGRKHVATWLRAFDWREEPTPSQSPRRLSPGQEREQRSAEAAANWLRRTANASE
jgi:hypothetical protein